MKLATLTLGCKVNSYDTEAMTELFLREGFELVDFNEYAHVYLINTCTVTNLGDKKSRQMIRRAKKINPEAIVIACGCYSQVFPEEVEKIKEVNIIIGTKERKNVYKIFEEYKSQNQNKILNCVADIMLEKKYEELSVEGLENKTRAYLKIQEGCDRFCSYCIIPYARGPVRSRKEEDVLKEVEIISKNGYKEIVLTGIHIASYGKDLKNTNLIQILKKVHEVEGIERIRMSSIEPLFVDKNFVNALKSLPKFCEHMHLSLQSGSDKTLRNMNRRYKKEDFQNSVELLRNSFPNISITTDIIVGFPGETSEDFIESLDFCEKMKLAKIHVFPYSPKRGTKAAEMDFQISKEEKTYRAKIFSDLDQKLQNEFLSKNLHKVEKVLFEKNHIDDIYEGHTLNYILVRAKSTKDIANKVHKVKLKSVMKNHILGELLL